MLSGRGMEARVRGEPKEPTRDESRTPTIVMSVPFARERPPTPPPPAPAEPVQLPAIEPLRSPGARTSLETTAIETHRVALIAEGSKILVMPLAAGEPPHPGLLVVLLVPTDPTTSAALAAMMEKFGNG